MAEIRLETRSRTPHSQVVNTLNLKEYGNKALGCWTGKNIGGTLGAPFESKKDMQDVTFYTQDLFGKPEPNDDLDLQLVWLQALEDRGAKALNERILAQYWVSYITAPWAEYGVCKANIRAGLLPPLSGSCNNAKWKNSNGAWIRSEIWACLFPGNPDLAIRYSYMDSCVDHSGEGIYASMFVAALESAAFVVDDLDTLIKIGLSKIPEDCRVARSVKIVCDHFARGEDYKAARAAVVEDSKDLGWFQAPGNVAFVIIGLLYGRGDFGQAVCLATNCGDDTDCTAATAGAIMGILLGRSGIPEKWTQPIGETIQTIAIDAVPVKTPKTLSELTNRVATAAMAAQAFNPDPLIVRLGDGPTHVDDGTIKALSDGEVAKGYWAKSPYELTFDLPYMAFSLIYENGPEIVEGEAKKLSLIARHPLHPEGMLTLDWDLPDGWQMSPCRQQQLYNYRDLNLKLEITLTPGKVDSAMVYLPLTIRLMGRGYPITVNVPFQCKGATGFWENYQWSEECFERMRFEQLRELVKVV